MELRLSEYKETFRQALPALPTVVKGGLHGPWLNGFTALVLGEEIAARDLSATALAARLPFGLVA